MILALALSALAGLAAAIPAAGHRLAEIPIRDPFILPDGSRHAYFLVASTGKSVVVRKSTDLETWGDPRVVFTIPPGFWGDEMIWAPEMHRYRGKYYLFATFMNNKPIGEARPNWPPPVERGTQVLVADAPTGPFKPFANEPHTPPTEMALDGTLWVEAGKPYMVYCREWVQVTDGEMKCMRLKPDLSAADGVPTVLFKASDAPWAPRGRESYVTDGPALFRTHTGKLIMLWSSFSETGYTTGIAVSQSGKLAGPWRQQEEPFYRKDGGHSMIFRGLDGVLRVALHSPNRSPDERAVILRVADTGDSLRILEP